MAATGRKFKAGEHFRVQLNNKEFENIRKASRLESILRVRGETWCSRLNSELHKAQRARKQPIADGYKFYIHDGGSRLRLYIVAFTARAQAHERKHSSILKLMETTKYDVKLQAQLTKEQRAAGAHAAKDLGDMSDEEFRAHMGKKAAKGASRAASPGRRRER